MLNNRSINSPHSNWHFDGLQPCPFAKSRRVIWASLKLLSEAGKVGCIRRKSYLKYINSIYKQTPSYSFHGKALFSNCPTVSRKALMSAFPINSYHQLLNCWHLIHPARREGIVSSCVSTGEPLRVYWIIPNPNPWLYTYNLLLNAVGRTKKNPRVINTVMRLVEKER